MRDSIEKFLCKHSGRIVGVGDIFDHSRSSVHGETKEDYLTRTNIHWQHIDTFVHGNHDSMFLKDFKHLKSCRIFKERNVLALHGHQLLFTFNQSRILKYEHRFYAKFHSRSSWFWDFEEWCCKTFNKFFMLHGKKAYAQALTTLEEVEKKELLDAGVSVVITGHTHLPFDVKMFYKGKRYRVVNCGSTLHGKVFKPVYVRQINKWFISDLHLGTTKSKLN